MKIHPKAILLSAVVFLLAANSCALAHTDVTVQEAKDLIDSTPDLIVVDVREPYEYCDVTGHIPGALNYPWSSGVLRERYQEIPMDRPILVVCRSGGRSNAAATFLDSNGFSMVYDMLRGINAWQWQTAPCKYSGGTGTPEDPYQIATAEDLITLGEDPNDYDKHFILTADIDLDPNLPGRKVFDKAVIAPDVNPNMSGFQGEHFNGVFNGNGHTISHLTIRGVNSLGLFGILDSGAKISNLGLIAVDVNGETGIGGLAGSSGGSIANSYSTGSVSGVENVGGLVGLNWGIITTNYSNGLVSGSNKVGGLVGYNHHKGNVIACFWDIETSGLPNMCGRQEDEATGCDDSHGKITADMQTARTFLDAGWDFVDEIDNGPNDIWWILEGRDYPKLWWEYPGPVFEIEITLGTDYENPDDPNDTMYEFELTVVTDGSVQRVEFIAPSGDIYKIPDMPQHELPVAGGWLETAREYDEKAGVYEWSYELKLDDPNGLADFGDGNYDIFTYYEDGTQEQTTAWFGIPGTDQPIPEPIQEPVLTSFADGDALAPPVAVEWMAPIDPAINRVLVELARQDAPEWLDFNLDKSATGIGEPLILNLGSWAADLVFAAKYEYKNSDFIKVKCLKYTETGYTFAVAQ